MQGNDSIIADLDAIIANLGCWPSPRRRLSFGLVAGAAPNGREETTMKIARYLWLAALSATSLFASLPASAQETVKIGLILPMTGPFASTGRQIETAVKLYMQQKGTTVAGKKIE